MLVSFKNKSFNLQKPLEISIPIENGTQNPQAFYAPDVEINPVQTEHFIGSTKEGGLVNFKNLQINPHGNGTHTECVGHIAKEDFFIKDCLKQFHFLAQLVSITPEKQSNGDEVITLEQIEKISLFTNVEAFVIRTLPNSIDKCTKIWSGSNPPYIHHLAVAYLVKMGVKHLLIDLPSIDREEDDGKLLAHKAFWKYPSKDIRTDCTITEMIFVPNEIEDNLYLLNIQTLPIKLDASPSRIVLFPQEI
jgi:kynurenine formamidase